MATAAVMATVGNGRTLEEFSKLIAARSKYLGETAADAVAACAIDALKSIRAATGKATKRSVSKDVEVKEDGTLVPSFKTVGGAKKFCVRYKGKGGAEYKGNEKVSVAANSSQISKWNVYRFTDEHGEKMYKYLIVAPDSKTAVKVAKRIKQKRAMRYSGLAKVALTRLMRKTATVSDGGEMPDATVMRKADENTKSIAQNGGKAYSLHLEDNLGYAIAAVKGGQTGVDLALRKAMNKITATVNQRCKKILGFENLTTPFPEVRQRKK